jgi:hypothetical protein
LVDESAWFEKAIHPPNCAEFDFSDSRNHFQVAMLLIFLEYLDTLT